MTDQVVSDRERSIMSRIQQGHPGICDAIKFLEALSPSDRDSILLMVLERCSGGSAAHSMFERYQKSRFLQPCIVDQRSMLLIEKLILDTVPVEWDAIELSPVSPIGINSTLACVNQKNVLSTIRRAEVQADATMALALECAARRSQLLKRDPVSSEMIHLCTHQRCLRLQMFSEDSGFTPHFKVFGACTAGRDEGMERFETHAITQHVSAYLDILTQSMQHGYRAQRPMITFSHMAFTEKLLEDKTLRDHVRSKTQSDLDILHECGVNQERYIEKPEDITKTYRDALGLGKEYSYLQYIDSKIVRQLRTRYPHVQFRYDLGRIAGIGYYPTLTFKLTAETSDGRVFPLGDGGLTPWTQKLIGSKKERLFISGFGTELFSKNFR